MTPAPGSAFSARPRDFAGANVQGPRSSMQDGQGEISFEGQIKRSTLHVAMNMWNADHQTQRHQCHINEPIAMVSSMSFFSKPGEIAPIRATTWPISDIQENFKNIFSCWLHPASASIVFLFFVD